MNWEILDTSKTSIKGIVDILLKNRGIKNKDEFLNPSDPYKTSLEDLDIKKSEIKKAIDRIKKAKEKEEKVIIYGDYDADGVCSTAIMWEALHEYGLDVLPHIPDRFEEGYGINAKSVENLKSKISNLKLVITVDNGIVAYEGIKKAKKLGIDVIVIDHHAKGTKKLATNLVIHSTVTSGAGLSYFFVKEILKKVGPLHQGSDLIKTPIGSGLELAVIGVIADQMQLAGINRSIVKYGLEELGKTKRPGLLALFEEAGIVSKKVGPLHQGSDLIKPLGTYEVNYIIAPRINAMGRLKHGLESLRLLCTRDSKRAKDIAKHVGDTNLERQRMVEVALNATKGKEYRNTENKVIVLAGNEYHEGIIGLIAGKITEEFYRPSIVLSVKGDKAKASARSINGFDIIGAIRNSSDLILEGGGHPMAAGFSIETSKIEVFKKKINEYAEGILTDELLQKKLKIDCQIDFDQISINLVEALKEFEPFGNGNYTPLFCTKNVEIVESKPVGTGGKHLKLKLKQNGIVFDAIYFNFPNNYQLLTNNYYSIAFSVEENVWNNHTSLQLKVKDVK